MNTNQSIVSFVQENCVNVVAGEDINYIKAKDALLQWVIEHASDLSEESIELLASDLVKLREDGEVLLKQILFRLKKENKLTLLADSLADAYYHKKSMFSLLPAGFAILERFGYPSGFFNAVEGPDLAQVRAVRWRNRGLSLDKKGEPKINPNIFASHVLRRMTLVQHESGQFFVYSKKGNFIVISDLVIKAVCRNIINEAEPNLWRRKLEKEYFEALKLEIPIVKSMNLEKGFVNLTNGMLNLYKMELVEHSPKFLSTIQIPFDYNPDAECPTFMRFLEDVFEGDQERIMLIQEILGYLFLPDVKIQKAFFFVGLGSNGKSVLAEVIRNLVGHENVSNVSLTEMGGRFGMQDLPGKLVCMSTENEFSGKFKTQKFKNVTGSDSQYIDVKFNKPINAVLSAKVVILLNRMMDTEDLSHGFFRRLQIIPFNKRYEELKAGQIREEGVSYADKNLVGKILSEMPGILRFAMEGLTRLIENQFNLTESKVCEKALQDYKAKQNPVVEYLNSRIEAGVIIVDPEASTRRSNFREDFKNWALDNDYNELTSINQNRFLELFRKVLNEKNITIDEPKLHGEYVIKGLRLCGYW